MTCQSLRYLRVLLLALSASWAALPGDARAQSDRPKGQRVFICGHSFHMPIAEPLGEIARAAGIDHKFAGKQGIGGSQVIQHWNLAEDKNTLKMALRAGAVDVLTLAPHARLPDEGINKFTALALEHSANIRILVQASWAAFDLMEGGRTNFKNEQRDSAKIDTLRKTYEPYYKKLQDQVKALNDEARGKQKRQVVYLVPVGHAVVALREQVVAGKVPGFARQSQLFRDPIGHGTAPIYALATYCHFAAIYGRSPVGLPAPKLLARDVNAGDVDKLNRLLQEIAWDAVTREPLSGVTK